MTDFNYKKYSLENLENWLHDAMSAGEASPQEIYDVILDVVKDNYYTHKEQTSKAYELLTLLNGTDNNKYQDYLSEIMSCDKDDPSPECKGAWNDFWESSHQEYLKNKVDGYSVEGKGHSEYWYEYDRNDPTRENPFTDKVVKWQLPVELDGLTGECYINLPDDLLERAGLKEGDTVEWIDREDGSFEMRKVNGAQ